MHSSSSDLALLSLPILIAGHFAKWYEDKWCRPGRGILTSGWAYLSTRGRIDPGHPVLCKADRPGIPDQLTPSKPLALLPFSINVNDQIRLQCLKS